MKPNVICTIVSKTYLTKFISLYNSLIKNNFDFYMWVLSMDKFTSNSLKLLNLSKVGIIPLKLIEQDAEILKEKEGKKENEYAWMLKAPLVEYILLKKNAKSVLYTDSDLYFFKSPNQIFKYLNKFSVYLSPQSDKKDIEDKYGKYQAGLIGFKKDKTGLDAIKWWKTKCLQWCYHKYDPKNKRYGDQKYLDSIPTIFKNVKCETNFGINAAPWNCIYSKERSISIVNGKPKINGDEVIVFHFACITIYNLKEFDLWNLSSLEIPNNIKNTIYLPYIKEIIKASNLLLEKIPESKSVIFSNKDISLAKSYFILNDYNINSIKYSNFYNICTIVNNSSLLSAIALHKSLIHYQNNFNLWICVEDKEAFNALTKLNLKNVKLINKLKTKLNVPVIIDYLLNKEKLSKVLYCDATMYFYESLNHIFDIWGSHSFIVKRINRNYYYGLIGLKKDKYGNEILSWWKDKSKLSNDIKSVDEIPNMFSNIKIIQNLGISVTPNDLILSNKITEKNKKIYINKELVNSYNFKDIKVLDINKFDFNNNSKLKVSSKNMRLLYYGYLNNLNKIMKDLKEKGININKFINVTPLKAL